MKESFFADSPQQDKCVEMYPTERKDGKAGHQMSKRQFSDLCHYAFLLSHFVELAP